MKHAGSWRRVGKIKHDQTDSRLPPDVTFTCDRHTHRDFSPTFGMFRATSRRVCALREVEVRAPREAEAGAEVACFRDVSRPVMKAAANEVKRAPLSPPQYKRAEFVGS